MLTPRSSAPHSIPVDCTADGKPLCDEVGVRGYPTIKYVSSNRYGCFDTSA